MDVENTTLIWIVLGGCAHLVLACLAGQFNIWILGFEPNQFKFFKHALRHAPFFVSKYTWEWAS